MNKILTAEIIKHIFSGLAIIESSFVNMNKTKSLMSKDFLLKETLSFEEDNMIISNNIWGCQLLIDKKEIKMLLGNCSQDKNYPEYCLLVQLKDSPSYALYFIEEDPLQSLIACSVDGNKWMQCSTYLQATFLAGMENVKDIALSWDRCTNYNSQYQSLQSFIKYYNLVYEVENAGQES